MADARQLSELLQNNTFGKLVARVDQLKTIDNILKKLLPTSLQPFCQVMNWQNGDLVVAVKNASAATCLRYQAPELLTQLRRFKTLADLKSLDFKVRQISS